MVNNSVVHKEFLEQGHSKKQNKKHRQIAKGSLKYTSAIVEDSIDYNQQNFVFNRLKMFGDKNILSHFYVSWSHFSLCTQNKNFSKTSLLNFWSQHALSQNFSSLHK